MPHGLSFEVNHEWMHAGRKCLEWSHFGSDVRFNWIFGANPKQLDSPRWISREEMIAVTKTEEFAGRMEPCDIIAVRNPNSTNTASRCSAGFQRLSECRWSSP
jgi:predicted NAD-dependent protein-ADP-ribosyltransferase YbiA (DUF1768 family)